MERTQPSRKAATAELDALELRQLAIQAMRSGRDEEALNLLQRAIERDPADGNPHHIRGAIYASQGETGRAVEAMTQALVLDPQLQGARFQLGMLHLANGDLPAAQSVWQPFEALDADHPLRLFKTGMLHLGKDEFGECVALLKRGIAVCSVESINNDMRRVIERIRPLLTAHSNRATVQSGDTRHVLLGRYSNDKNET